MEFPLKLILTLSLTLFSCGTGLKAGAKQYQTTKTLFNTFSSFQSRLESSKLTQFYYFKVFSSGVYKLQIQNPKGSLKKNVGKTDKLLDGVMKPSQYFNKERGKMYTKSLFPSNSTRTGKLLKTRDSIDTSVASFDYPNLKKSLRQNVYSINLEIQVLLDSVVFEDIQAAISRKEVQDVEEYLLIFFNSVNHVYALSHPNDIFFPEINITVCNYQKIPAKAEDKIFAGVSNDASVHVVESVLKYLRAYAKKYLKDVDQYDHTILLTGRDLHRKLGNNYDPGVLGVAFLNGMCTKSSSEKFEAFSVVEDPGAMFLGVYPAVHELAHNLGVKHDSKSDAECNSKHGYIMSPSTSGTNNIYHFSTCSLESMRLHLSSDRTKCLQDSKLKSISSNTSSGIRLPGELYSMNNICTHLAETNYPNEVDVAAEVNTSKSPSDLCKQISCKVTINGRKFVVDLPLPPGEKTSCGNNGNCIQGECIVKKLK